MNSLHRVSLLLGTLISLFCCSATAQAQSCASSGQTPLTKVRLEAISNSLGIPPTLVELRFESFALNTIQPAFAIPRNFKKFPSPERAMKVGIPNVQPDGVLPLVVVGLSGSMTYEESVFYEAKTARSTLLPPSYQRYQIRGFLDALQSSPAGVGGLGVPAIVFMTTSDVRVISKKTRLLGTLKGVGILHTIACEVPGALPSQNLQLGNAAVVNPELYLLRGISPLPVGSGRLGGL